jgi:hypothetical protein
MTCFSAFSIIFPLFFSIFFLLYVFDSPGWAQAKLHFTSFLPHLHYYFVCASLSWIDTSNSALPFIVLHTIITSTYARLLLEWAQAILLFALFYLTPTLVVCIGVSRCRIYKVYWLSITLFFTFFRIIFHLVHLPFISHQSGKCKADYYAQILNLLQLVFSSLLVIYYSKYVSPL